VISLFLAISFITIFKISTYSAKVASVFPPVDCNGITELFSGDQFRAYAVDDYEYITEKSGRRSSGILPCFCHEEAKIDTANYMTNAYGSKDESPICGEFTTL